MSASERPTPTTGETHYHGSILDVQVRQVVSRLSPAHALALLALHRITSGKRIKTYVEVSEAGLGTTLGITAGHAGNLLRDLEADGIVKVQRRRAKNNARIASRVKLCEGYQVNLPYRAPKLRGYYSVPNAVPDARQREIVSLAGGRVYGGDKKERQRGGVGVRAYLVYFVLAARADADGLSCANRKELARQTGLSPEAVKRSIRALADVGAISNEGFSNEGAEFRITPNVAVRPQAHGGKVGTGSREGWYGWQEGVGTGSRDNKVSSSNRGPITHQPLSKKETPDVSSSRGVSAVGEVSDRGGEAVFRTSATQPVGQSSWPAREEPASEKTKGSTSPADISQNSETHTNREQSDEADGVASQPVFDQSAWAKATVEERLLAEYMAKRGIVQKLVPPPQARKTKGQTRDENEPRSDGGKDGASVPAAQPEPGWKMSASLAREIASAFGDYRNGDLDGDLLQKVSGNAYSEMEKRYPDEARHSPEALVRSIVGTFGRVVGAYERGEATHLRPYLRSALWKNIESGWRLLEYEPWRFEGADGRVHGDEDRHGSVADAVAAEIEAFEDGQITAAHERQAS